MVRRRSTPRSFVWLFAASGQIRFSASPPTNADAPRRESCQLPSTISASSCYRSQTVPEVLRQKQPDPCDGGICGQATPQSNMKEIANQLYATVELVAVTPVPPFVAKDQPSSPTP